VDQQRIIRDPGIMSGKPVVRGTRITVEQILRELAEGRAPEEILRQHPRLSADDIRAAQGFAAAYLANEEIAFE